VWVIEGILEYQSSTVQVFDKWGDKVFEKTGYKNNWDAGGMPDGTYFYMIKLEATSVRGEEVLTGSLLIKR